MISIGIIATDAHVYAKCLLICRELGLEGNVDLREGVLEGALAIARHMAGRGVDVIVSRGSTVEAIEAAGLGVPVVSIPLSIHDLSSMLIEARELTGLARPRIAVVTYSRMDLDLKSLSLLLDMDLHVYKCGSSRASIEETVRRAVADGADVLVGGKTTRAALEKMRGHNTRHGRYVSSEDSVRQALVEARRVAVAREFERRGGNDNLSASAFPCDGIMEVGGKERRPKTAKSKPGIKTCAGGMAARHTFADIAGNSPQIRAAVAVARKYAESDAPVLILGATGTGKELFAQAIHNAGPHRNGPFVAVNCAALPPSLLESELFGYEAGAFTGAGRNGRSGMFELAHRGTIFLDEVSSMDRYGQMRLLRVLQEKYVMRLGSDKFLPVDFKVVAASNADLREQVARGEFREDLFYRLNFLPLTLPLLSERQGDAMALAHLFLARPGTVFTVGAAAALEAYPWPGNVRELRSCMERIRLLADGPEITEKHVREALGLGCALVGAVNMRGHSPAPCAPCAEPLHAGAEALNMTEAPDPDSSHAPAAHGRAAENPERERIVAALRRCNGRQGKAAGLLGMDKSTLYRKMKRLGIRREVF